MMTDWKIVSKKLSKTALCKKKIVKNFPHFFYTNQRYICLEQQLAKKLSRKQFANKVVRSKPVGGNFKYLFN